MTRVRAEFWGIGGVWWFPEVSLQVDRVCFFVQLLFRLSCSGCSDDFLETGGKCLWFGGFEGE